MRTYTIPQKMSGTGSIHDLASEHSDRVIQFPKGAKYAIVLAAHYGGKGYTTHRTQEAAIEADRRVKDFNRQIIDDNGRPYDVKPGRNGDMLVKR